MLRRRGDHLPKASVKRHNDSPGVKHTQGDRHIFSLRVKDSR